MSNRNYDRGYTGRTSGRTASRAASYEGTRSRSAARRQWEEQEYWYGTEAPALDPWQEEEEPYRAPEGRQKRRTKAQKAPARRTFMNPFLIAFMAGVMCLMSFFLIEYISLQSQVTGTINEIAQLETQLASLKSDNDETLNEINSSINLDDIKYRAIAQLGMTYAKEDQIVTYDGGSGDYVRQVSELKK